MSQKLLGYLFAEPQATPEELTEAGFVKVESMPTPYGYYLWLWVHFERDVWYAQRSEIP